MFTKIHYKFYDILFELYGKRAERYAKLIREDVANRRHWERKYRKCIDRREDILEIMFILKGLI